MYKMRTHGFHYKNVEFRTKKGVKTVRKVAIHNGGGTKSVTTYRGNKKLHTIRRPIHIMHIESIKRGKFVRGLFSDCRCDRKTRKRRAV